MDKNLFYLECIFARASCGSSFLKTPLFLVITIHILIFCCCFLFSTLAFFSVCSLHYSLLVFLFRSTSKSNVFFLAQPGCSLSFRVHVCNSVCLITASVAVTALGYKHHQSRRDVTLFIARLFVRLLKRLCRAAKLSEAQAEGKLCRSLIALKGRNKHTNFN